MNAPVMIPDKPDFPDSKIVAVMSNEWPGTLACFDIGTKGSIDVSLAIFKLIPERLFRYHQHGAFYGESTQEDKLRYPCHNCSPQLLQS